jgi:hypothetical protein
MTVEIKQAMDHIIDLVEALELKESAPVKEPVNNTLNQ